MSNKREIGNYRGEMETSITREPDNFCDSRVKTVSYDFIDFLVKGEREREGTNEKNKWTKEGKKE